MIFKLEKNKRIQIISLYWELYGIFNTYIVIDDHGYDGNYINGIIDQTDKGIGVITGLTGSMDRL